MRRLFCFLAISGIASLSACSAGNDATSEEASAEAEDAAALEPVTIVTVEGIRTNDPTLDPANAIPFGTPRETTDEFVTQLRTAPTEPGSDQMCPAGPMAFSTFDNLTLSFQGEQFVGWMLGDENTGDPITTPSGLTIGSTREDVEAAPQAIFEETSLGTEFTADGVDGLMSDDGPDAIITSLWAGTNCIFR